MAHYYTGIGSRAAPRDIWATLEDFAQQLAARGYRLRSGHAEGADKAFERGARGNADVFLPWNSFGSREDQSPPRHVVGHAYIGVSEAALALGSQFHPAWTMLSRASKLLIARNSYQVLGFDLETPSDFIVCWTPQGQTEGGTGQAIRLAAAYNIPVYNLGGPSGSVEFPRFLTSLPTVETSPVSPA